MPILNAQALIRDREEAIRSYHNTVGIPRAEIDVSGGIDSAVMLMLLSRALGPENVTAVYTGIHSSPESKARAIEVGNTAGVKLILLDLTAEMERMNDKIRAALGEAGYDLTPIIERLENEPTVQGSFRSCLRAPVGRYLNRLTGNGIRHGTGNECEDRWLRFYQKGGDGEVDSNPIAMLSKGEVFQFARALGVPRSILEATPTHDLHEGAATCHDEEELRNWTGVEWTYSRVNPDTGEYVHVGTIERLSRFLDHQFAAWFDSMCGINGGWLFAAEKGHDDVSGDWEFNMDALVTEAKAFFEGFSDDEVRAFLVSARKIERITRHKVNPNCPTLGPGWRRTFSDGVMMRKSDREMFIVHGILSNKLPKVNLQRSDRHEP